MTFERGDKHGPRVDDALAAETQAINRTGHSAHAEEWREPEPSGEDQPDVDRDPDGTLTGGTPPGMSADDVEGRSELARFLRPTVFPADAATLRETANRENAPASVLRELDRLPAGDRHYENVQDVWRALGHGVESRRT